MSEQNIEDKKLPGLEALAIDAESYINGAWVPVRGSTAEIRVARATGASFAEWLAKAENKALYSVDREKAERAYYGEVVIRAIRGIDATWSPESGRKLLTETKAVVDESTGEEVHVYVYDPVFEAAIGANSSATTYKLQLLGN